VAQALQAGGMSIAPAPNDAFPGRNKGWFMYEEVEPGQVIEDFARVINLDSKPATLTVESVDAFMLPDGGFALVEGAKNNTDIGNWVELSATEVTLPPNKEKIVPFKIKIPADAEVGDHIGALAVYKSNNEPTSTVRIGGTGVGISTRVGARIYLTIKGDITRKLALHKRTMYGRGQILMFNFKLSNLGNVRADLAVTARIYGIWGLYDKREDVPIGQIFPQKTLYAEVPWPGKARPIFGPYWASITIEDTFKGLNPASSTLPLVQPIHTWAFAFFIPWTQIAVLVLLLFLAWFVVQTRRWLKMRGLAQTPVVPYRVKRGDQLVDVAIAFSISWKLLAQLNGIKPPYSLRGVAMLYVPDTRGKQRDIKVSSLVTYLLKPFKPFRGWFKRLASRLKKDEVMIVEGGDTIRDVERFAGMSWAKLMTYNKLAISTRLKAGMELKMPGRERDGKK